MSSRNRWTAVLACAALTATLGCDSGFIDTGGYLVSNEQEVELGKGVDVEIEKEYKIVDASEPLAQWGVQLAAKLQAASVGFRDPAEFGGYKVEVIADDELVNAFAAPGGYTYVSTGLILSASSCAEIAGVLGHEMGHVAHRHGVKALEKSYLATELATALLGEGTGSDLAVLAWEFLASTKFSQIQEKQSDSTGLQIAFDAGYNPYALVDFFQVLLAQERAAGVAMPEFLSSHPETQDRINAITAEIESRYGAAVNPKTTQSYECQGTQLKLIDVQNAIKAKQYKIKAGTGTQPRQRGN